VTLFCSLQFFPEVAQNYTIISRVFQELSEFKVFWVFHTAMEYVNDPYLTLPPGWTGSYTCPALRPYM